MDKELLEAVFKAGYRIGRSDGFDSALWEPPEFSNAKEAWLHIIHNKDDELNKPEFWNYV